MICGMWLQNSIPSFNFEKLTESLFLCLCLLLSFVQVQSLIQLLVNIWKFLLQTTQFSTHFMILHNFCFLFLNWQQVVNVSHDSQYVAKRKLKCHWIRLHRIIKQIYILTKIIYMDNGQRELCPRFATIWGLSCQGPNNKNLLPIQAI